MPLTQYMQKQTLDWITGAAAATRPVGRFLQFATTSPRSDSAFDGPFTPRITVTFAAASSPIGTATNLNAMTGTATAAATAVGWNLYDSAVGGTRIAYGTLTASIGCASADNPAFAAGAIRVAIT